MPTSATEKTTRTRTIARLAFMIAAAMILSYIESLIPTFVYVPGIKLGLANIAIMFSLYLLGPKSAVIVSLVRVFLIAVLFGSLVTLAYSAAGAALSLVVMILMKRSGLFHPLTVSISAAVAHNLGQIGAACLLLQTSLVLYYLPYLLLAGIVSGAVIGILSGLLIERLVH